MGGKDALLALKNAKGKEAPKNVDLKNKVETEEERLMKMSASIVTGKQIGRAHV